MNQDKPEILKIKSTHPASQGPFVLINKQDFDPKKHELFKGEKLEKTIEPPAPVAVVIDGQPPAPAPLVNITKDAAALAVEAGLDPSAIVGTGKHGKITVEDVEAEIEKLTAPTESAE